MLSTQERDLLNNLDEFASVDVIKTRHRRRARRAVLTIAGCALAWGLCQVLLAQTVKSDVPSMSGRPLFLRLEYHLFANDPVWGGVLVSGQVHAAQAVMMLIGVVTLGRLAFAHWRLPGALKDAASRRASITPERVQELFNEKALKNASLTSEGELASTAALGRGVKGVTMAGIVCCMVALGSMESFSEHIFKFDRWERAMRNGVFGYGSFGILVVGVLCLCAAPLWAVYAWERAGQRRLLAEAREDMLVLHAEVCGGMEGALSHVDEGAQKGGLTVREGPP